MVVDRTDENFTQMDTSLADTDGITWTLYQLVAGVASIPEYNLYGTAMKGFNSTGEGETKNYLQMLRGMQENVFEPFLRKAYAIICRSDLGNREKYDIVFNPLSVPTDAEQAATQGAKSSYYGNLINAGVVSPEEVRQALRQDENSGFTDIAEDLPEDTGGGMGGMPGNENGNFKSAFGRYTEAEYDRITNEIAEKYDLEINVGVYGNPEVSFHIMDFEKAKEIALDNNQESVFICAENWTWDNVDYNSKDNPENK